MHSFLPADAAQGLCRGPLDQCVRPAKPVLHSWIGAIFAATATGNAGTKPLMIVVAESFSGGHSICHTHARAIEAARRHFEGVRFGFGYVVNMAVRRNVPRFRKQIPRSGDVRTPASVQQEYEHLRDAPGAAGAPTARGDTLATGRTTHAAL